MMRFDYDAPWEEERADLLDRLRDDLELHPWPQTETAPADEAEAA